VPSEAVGWGIVLTGDKELIRKMQRLAEKTQKRIVQKAMKKGAARVRKAAKRRVPVETGLLKKSLGSKVARRKRDKVVVGIIGPRTGFKKQMPDGSYRNPVRYAHLVELGTKRAGAKPFLRPAFEQERDGAVADIRKKLWEELRKEARK